MKSRIKIIVYVILLLILLIIFFVIQKNEKKEITLTVDYTQDLKGLGYSGQRKIAQDSAGNFFVTYRKKYQEKYEIFVAKIYNEKGNWRVSGTNKPAANVDSEADQRVPSIFIGNNDVIYVVWYGSDRKEKDQKNNRQIKFIKSEDNGDSWSMAKNISIVDGFEKEEEYWQEHPYLLVGKDNNLYVVWEGKDKDNKNQQIKFSKSLDGGQTWTQWKNVLVTPENTQSRPTLVQAGNGRLYLFSYSSSENPYDNQQIKYTSSDNGGESWSQWLAITDAAVDSRHESVAINDDGIHIVWRQIASDGKSNIFYRLFDGENWTEQIAVNNSKNNQFFPSIAISNDRKIIVAWMETMDESSLPREDPRSGEIYTATLNRNNFYDIKKISLGEKNLYPNSPIFYKGKFIPIVYESFESDNKYGVIFKMFK